MEACVVSSMQAYRAQSLGADRIEICTHLESGGMTPDENTVEALVESLSLPIRVMIRSTASGFEAHEEMLIEMIHSINRLKLFPIEGFVIGLLKNGSVDRGAMETLLMHAAPYPITFHKAIDQSGLIMEDITWMNSFPQIDTILTSGGAIYAVEGIDVILKMKSIFSGKIMAAGKILPHHLDFLHQKLNLEWYHGQRIVGDLS